MVTFFSSRIVRCYLRCFLFVDTHFLNLFRTDGAWKIRRVPRFQSRPSTNQAPIRTGSWLTVMSTINLLLLGMLVLIDWRNVDHFDSLHNNWLATTKTITDISKVCTAGEETGQVANLRFSHRSWGWKEEWQGKSANIIVVRFGSISPPRASAAKGRCESSIGKWKDFFKPRQQ